MKLSDVLLTTLLLSGLYAVGQNELPPQKVDTSKVIKSKLGTPTEKDSVKAIKIRTGKKPPPPRRDYCPPCGMG